MTVTVTILDTFKSKVNYQVADSDTNIFDLGVSPALIAADWTVYDATADASGYQTVTADVPVAASDVAISTPATYYFKVDTDGGGITEYSVVVAAPTTFTALAALMDTAWAGGTVTFDDTNNRFVFTSGTMGLTSSVSVTAGTTGVDVFVQIAINNLPVTGFTYNPSVNGTVAVTFTNTLSAGASQGYAEVGVGGNKVGGSATGLTNSAVTYQATVTIDGVASPVLVTGSAAQTYTTLLAEINTDLPGTPAFLINGNLRMTSPTAGSTSTVTVTNGPATSGSDSVSIFGAPAGAVVPGLAAASYDFDITIDGGGLLKKVIVVAGTESYNALAALMNAQVTGVATITYTGGAFVATSATTGVTSTVVLAAGTFGSGGGDLFTAIDVITGGASVFNASVGGIGALFSSLTGFTAITSVAGVGAGDANAYQVVDVAANKVGATATGLSNTTAGYQEAVFVYQKVGTDSTGLANAATAYTATATIDGVARAISVVGSAAQTITTLIAELNTDIGAWATVALVGGRIRVTSLTSSSSSTVSLADSGANSLFASLSNFYLFAPAVVGTTPVYTFTVVFDNGAVSGYQVVNVGGNKTASSATNLVGATTYTASIAVDGTPHAISILGSTAQTYGDLLTQIQTDLVNTAVVGLVGGNIRVISNSTTVGSSVAITAGTLFAAPLDGFVSVVAAVPSAVIAVSVAGSAALTYTTLLSEINTDLGANGVASLVGGNLRITSSNALPANSAVNILTTGTLLTRGGPLTDCNGVQPPVGGVEDNAAAVFYVVSRRGSGSFSYQEFATWNIGLNTGTGPGDLNKFNRNTTSDSALYLYTAGSTGESLVIG